MSSGKLFRVDPGTGVTKAVDLGGELVDSNDGILREGRVLYVAQVFTNQLAKVELDPTGHTGRIVQHQTGDKFDFPTAVAGNGSRLYVVNARFASPPTSETGYSAVSIPRF